ncbi:hypothetical protein LTR66_017477, partial [Elasticomyces elasticus]
AVGDGNTTVDAPSPRRGSKRSLINRSRQGSRSSRKSARNTTTASEAKDVPPVPRGQPQRTEKKQKKGGFLSFLNCCGAGDDDFTPEETELPAKQRKIESPALRVTLPEESKDVISTEKSRVNEPAFTEKNTAPTPTVEENRTRASDKQKENVKPSILQDEQIREQGSTAAPIAAGATTVVAPSAPTRRDETAANPPTNRLSIDSVYDQVTRAPATSTSMPVVPTAPLPQFPPPPVDHDTARDATMVDAPIVPPVEEQTVVDEPTQPHDQQPNVALPPPPPLETRMAQNDLPPPVPEVPAEKQQWLLPPVQRIHKGRKCLILDLDETLVHSSFKILNQADFTIPVEIEGQYHNVYVIKRPGVDQFMKR